MKKIVIGELFDIVFTRPIEVDRVIRLIDSFPELAIKRVEENGLSELDAVNEVNNEFMNFLENMDEADSSEFLKIAKPLLADKTSKSINDSVSIMDPDRTKWNFYIRFRVSEPLGVDKNFLKFFDQFIIEADNNKSLKAEKVLVLRNNTSLIYREILPLSKKVEQVLIMAFAELGIGIAYPENLASGFVLDKIQEEIESVNFLIEN